VGSAALIEQMLPQKRPEGLLFSVQTPRNQPSGRWLHTVSDTVDDIALPPVCVIHIPILQGRPPAVPQGDDMQLLELPK
jgi:hypothetical protein